MIEKAMYTTVELAQEARRRGILITRQHIGRLIRSGEIKANQYGGRWFIDRAEAERWFKERKDGQQ